MTSRRACLLAVLGAVAAQSCGYEPLYGGALPERGLTVVPDAPGVARPELVTAALAGARARLARARALGSGGYPRLVITVDRVDERSTGVVVRDGAKGDEPTARGSSVAVLGRAWVIEAPGAAPTRPTGTLRWAEPHATRGSSPSDALAADEALRRAARALGDALAARILGEPVAAMPPP